MSASLKVIYFAWVRERIGVPDETVAPPPEVATAGDLIHWLAGRGEGYAHALQSPDSIRVAVDRMHVGHDEPIAGAREIALFPPMTGG
ncbi:MAG TPA: molybdopterin converting factor subunit 1 [Methylomirabilota bacterium]|nr:molybdopterin converting factor subunit 1 [Methylomirabilota bacterium]